MWVGPWWQLASVAQTNRGLVLDKNTDDADDATARLTMPWEGCVHWMNGMMLYHGWRPSAGRRRTFRSASNGRRQVATLAYRDDDISLFVTRSAEAVAFPTGVHANRHSGQASVQACGTSGAGDHEKVTLVEVITE